MRVTRTRIALTAALVAVVAFFGFRTYEGRATESRLSAIASEIAGRDVRVECQGAVGAALDVSGESGSVWFDAEGRPADVAQLKRDVCTQLNEFAEQHGTDRFACLDGGTGCELEVLHAVHALQTLAHEAWHLAGEQNEAVTECYALQSIALVAIRLGARPDRAEAAARTAFTELYPRMPDAYRTPTCRDGGPLDQNPATNDWP